MKLSLKNIYISQTDIINMHVINVHVIFKKIQNIYLRRPFCTSRQKHFWINLIVQQKHQSVHIKLCAKNSITVYVTPLLCKPKVNNDILNNKTSKLCRFCQVCIMFFFSTEILSDRSDDINTLNIRC